jgi:hypothetical protein
MRGFTFGVGQGKAAEVTLPNQAGRRLVAKFRPQYLLPRYPPFFFANSILYDTIYNSFKPTRPWLPRPWLFKVPGTARYGEDAITMSRTRISHLVEARRLNLLPLEVRQELEAILDIFIRFEVLDGPLQVSIAPRAAFASSLA